VLDRSHARSRVGIPSIESIDRDGGGGTPRRRTNKMADNAVWKAVKPYVNGGLSGMASTCVIQPLDSASIVRCDAMRCDAMG